MDLTVDKVFKILVVDDNEKNIQVLGSCLREANYTLGFATDGIQALNLLQEANDYDLILLDVGMPVMDGFETCKAIRKINRFRDTPIIFITAYDDLDSIVKGFDLGGQDYITKPFNQKELIARVRTHLELKNVKDNLKDVNRWLEEKVEERTLELHQLNRHLENQANDVLEAYLKLEKVNDELQTLDESKTAFLKLIAYDICTPLNSLMSFLKNIKDQLALAGNADIIDIIDKAAIRLDRFSQVASRITELRTRNAELFTDFVAVGYFVDFTKDKLTRDFKQDYVPLDFEQNVINSTFQGDKDLLQICFESIIDNVFRYTNEDSLALIHVSSDEENIIFDFINKETLFVNEVSKNLNKILTPGKFYSEQNFGLDMALIKIIMDAHKGNVSIRNNDAEGAVVSLYFKKH
ncbi:MAG: response regulator [Bacteroidota bacterium]|nr:response regulator [Bacteroidota bacterium]